MNDTTAPDDDVVEFNVTFTRGVTVHVPASLVPDGFRMPGRIRNLPDNLYDAIIAAVPESLGDLDPKDFGEIDSIANDSGDASIGD